MPLQKSVRMDTRYFDRSEEDEGRPHTENAVSGADTSPAEKKYPEYCKTFTYTDASGHVKELVLPRALDLDRPKRARTTFTAEQLYQLETEFNRNQYLVGRERTKLAQKLQLSETQVKVWFQNRRTKCKRDRGREDDVPGSSDGLLTTKSLTSSFHQQLPQSHTADKPVRPPTAYLTTPDTLPFHSFTFPGMYSSYMSDFPYIGQFGPRPYRPLPTPASPMTTHLRTMATPIGAAATASNSLGAVVSPFVSTAAPLVGIAKNDGVRNSSSGLIMTSQDSGTLLHHEAFAG